MLSLLIVLLLIISFNGANMKRYSHEQTGSGEKYKRIEGNPEIKSRSNEQRNMHRI